jgi:hypothetical protein
MCSTRVMFSHVVGGAMETAKAASSLRMLSDYFADSVRPESEFTERLKSNLEIVCYSQ